MVTTLTRMEEGIRQWYCYNPYINSVNRDEWQRGYDDAEAEDDRVKNEYALRLDDLWNVSRSR